MASAAIVVLVMSAVLAACGGGASHQGSKELNIYTWTDYIPNSVIEGFERQYGVNVRIGYYPSNEAAIAGLRANPGHWDIVVPSDYAVQILIRSGMLEPINPSTDLHNFSNIAPDFRFPFYDPGSGLRSTRGRPAQPKYSVPYQWGTTGIAYNAAKVSFTPTSWADLARPEFRGKVALIDDAREVLGAGLIVNGYSKDDASPSHLAKAAQWVQSLHAVHVNVNHPEMPLLTGQAVISIMYNGDATEAMAANPDIRYVLPASGGIWFDNLAIPRAAPHRATALAFIDYVLRADVGAQITRFFGYSTPNAASLALLLQEKAPAATNVATNPPIDALQGLLLTKDVGSAGSERFVQTWQRVRP
jgi:spermidine/putrescine-binding protein